jgi:uncharacterized protein (TIGR02466 family)
MSTQSLFATLVYSARLKRTNWQQLNERLLRECRQLRLDDAAGRRWSAQNYPGGYTSYNSASRMHELSPTFAELQRCLDRHVRSFARTLAFDLGGRKLVMTDCWVNIMPPHVAHGLHLHPLSTISGTYYVRTPAGAPGLKFEDPRLERFMAAPPRRARSSPGSRPWVMLPAAAGKVLLFESWLRHEVPPNTARGERVSISFNYGWF